MGLLDGPVPFKNRPYEYMVNQFDKMFDGDVIPHFNMRVVYCTVFDYVDEIKDTYEIDIQKELILWLRKEKDEKRLFVRDNWKGFRDNYDICSEYIGYNKLFQYKQYWFQLALEETIGNPIINCFCDDDCKYCSDEYWNEYRPHFELALYGWNDEKFEKLQPDNEVIIPSDNIMPELDWNRIY